MNAEKKCNETLYSEHVIDMIYEVIERRFAVMTMKQFAEFAGLKLTHNLRRRLKQARDQGYIQIHQNYAHYNTLQQVIVFDRDLWESRPF